MDIKFSVIVPVYNGGKTLGRCLDSLLAQNRRDVEILVIDDGSTDESPAIARRYAAENSAVIPLSQPHGGVSRARNRGMEAARGKYITFVDCDDFVVPDYFSRLAQAPHSDLLVFARAVPIFFGGGGDADDRIDNVVQRKAVLIKMQSLVISDEIEDGLQDGGQHCQTAGQLDRQEVRSVFHSQKPFFHRSLFLYYITPGVRKQGGNVKKSQMGRFNTILTKWQNMSGKKLYN